MKAFFIGLFICFSVIGNAQVAYFNKKYDLRGSADESSAIVTTNSGYVVCGNGYHSSTGFLGVCLLFLNMNGDSLYTKWVGKNNYHYFDGWGGAFRKYSKGGFYLGGAIGDTSGTIYGMLYLFDDNGDTLWTKKYGNGTDFYALYHARETPDKGFILAGARGIGSNTQGLLIKTDSLGNVEWEQNYGGNGTEYGMVSLPLMGGGYMLGGHSRTLSCTNGDDDQWLVKTNSSGTQQWQKCYGSIDSDGDALPGYEFSNGDLIYASHWALNSIKWYPYISRVDSNGDTIWSRKIGPVGTLGFLRNMTVTGEEDVLAVGKWAWANGAQGLLVRVTSDGDSLWYRKYDYNPSVFANDELWDIDTAHGGGYVMCGTTNQSSVQDVWVIKVDEHGCLNDPDCWYSQLPESPWSFAGVDENTNEFFSLYPNPNNGKFFIENKTGTYSGLEIKIYNPLGEQLYFSVFSNVKAEIDLSGFSNGIYFIEIRNKEGLFWNSKIIKE